MRSIEKMTLLVLISATLMVVNGCNKKSGQPGTADKLKKAELLVELPDYCDTPDAMALMPDGSIILSCPNFNVDESQAVIMKISPDNKVSKFFTPPVHPETKKAGPMGICLAPSGDLYYADNQFEGQKSSVKRIVMKDGKPTEAVTVVSGLNIANAVVVHDGFIYVSDTAIIPDAEPLISGVFKFKIGDEGLKLSTPLVDDPHLIATIETHHPTIKFGADGLAFDSKGNLYIGNFADGTLHKLTFDTDGKVASNTIFVKDEKMKCADGLFCDRETDRIFVADMIQNAVQIVYPDGKVRTLAMNGDTDGADGSIDQPCEAILRGNEVIISNMDWPFEGIVNTAFDKPYTISVVRLDD